MSKSRFPLCCMIHNTATMGWVGRNQRRGEEVLSWKCSNGIKAAQSLVKNGPCGCGKSGFKVEFLDNLFTSEKVPWTCTLVEGLLCSIRCFHHTCFAFRWVQIVAWICFWDWKLRLLKHCCFASWVLELEGEVMIPKQDVYVVRINSSVVVAFEIWTKIFVSRWMRINNTHEKGY